MRPYIAIIKDSFREALASRILYILLAIITILLVALAPLTYRLELTVGVREGDVGEWPDLIDKLKEAESETKPSPTRRVWTLLTADQQKAVRDFTRLKKQPQLKDVTEFQRQIRDIVKALDQVVRKPDFYDRPSWSGASLSIEGRQLAAKMPDKLDDQDKLRLNRILLESAFPGLMRVSPTTSFQFAYVTDVGPTLPITLSQFREALTATMPFLVDKILLSIGLLIAVVVTAPIIPQTFDPGSLHLLLSKPIGRSFLYLTKFAGGCAFVLLSATYLFIGLWLIMGVRFGIWEPRILMCIPLYAFVFGVYYSVAALAGVFWRNAIVSVIVTGAFWGVCFGIGTLKVMLEATVNQSRITKIVPVEGDIFVMDASKTPYVWDETKKEWKISFLTDEQKDFRIFIGLTNSRMLGPTYDPKHKQLLGATLSLSNGQLMVVAAKKDRDWRPIEGPPAPILPVALLNEPDGTPLLITNYSLQRVTGEITAPKERVKFLGYTLPSLQSGPLTEAGPSPSQNWGRRMTPAIDPKTGVLVIYDNGEFTTLALKSGKYERLEKKRLREKDRGRPVLAAAGGTILLGRPTGEITILDEKSLEAKQTVDPEKGSRVVAAEASPSGKWIAVLFENRRLLLYDVASGKMEAASVAGQGDISGIAFDKDDVLLVADRTTRVTQYKLANMQVEGRAAPTMSLYDRAFRHAVIPIYTVCPKPGEFYKTVTYLLSEPAKKANENEEDTGDDEDAPEASDDTHPWAPVWSSLAFMLVMLALGCVYMQYQEF